MKDFPMIEADKGSYAKRNKYIFGVGINDAWYFTNANVEGKKVTCPYYRKWYEMLRRCYSERYHALYPTYKECTVCEEWLTFSNFKSWMEGEDWLDKELDKDIIVPDNKIYSPETCVFVTKAINYLLIKKPTVTSNSGKVGVFYDKKWDNYAAQCCVNGKIKKIGRYKTLEEAYKAYVLFKYDVLYTTANRQDNPRVRDGILRHAEILMKTLEQTPPE